MNGWSYIEMLALRLLADREQNPANGPKPPEFMAIFIVHDW